MDSTALLLDVAQFFPSANHDILVAILRKQGFNEKLCCFFANYLKDRKTQFIFNGAELDSMDFSTGVGQGSSLLPILAGLYVALTLHKVSPLHRAVVVEEESKPPTIVRTAWTSQDIKANGHATIQFFVDDGLIHVAVKMADDSERDEQLKANNLVL